MDRAFVVTLAVLTSALVLPSPALPCPAHHRQLLDREREALRAELARIPLAAFLRAEAGAPSAVGRWGSVATWPVTPIHSALLPTGEVLAYSYPYQNPNGSDATLWDPASGTFTPVNWNRDLFCTGHSLLPDGRLFAAGGNALGCEFRGTADTHVFDPVSRAWTRLGDMAVARWYPSNTPLGDGRVIITAGLGDDCQPVSTMEIYTPGQGLEVIPEGARELALYPRIHLLSSGRIAHVGPEAATWTFDPATRSWQQVAAQTTYRWNGASVMVPGEVDEILVVGGDFPPTASAERIDFRAAQPAWRATGSLNLARAHHDLVILPDRTVLALGGGRDGLYGDPELTPELYDPVAETWTLLPAHALGRMYHATAMLLPDGRVLLAGQDDGASTFTAEIYEPAYLFRGPRPSISTAPAEIGHGRSFTVTSPVASTIAAISLVAPSSVTHGVNMGQRLLDLVFTRSGDSLHITAPPDPNHAPPGYYMIFLLDDQGVPSEGRFVLLATGIFSDGFEAGNLAAWSSAVP